MTIQQNRMFRKYLAGKPYPRDTHENQLFPSCPNSSHSSHVQSTCCTSREAYSWDTYENSFSLQLPWVLYLRATIWLYILSIRFLDIGAPGNMASRHEASEVFLFEDIIYVALGTDVRECKSILLWAVQNSGGKRICILHVHQPPQLIPFSMSQNLHPYLSVCLSLSLSLYIYI